MKNIKNKDDIHTVRQVLDEQKERQVLDDHSHKKTKKLEILHQKNEHLSKKINSLENHNQQLKQNYSSRLIDKQLTVE